TRRDLMRSITVLVSSLAILVIILGSSSYGEEYTADYWLEQAKNYYSAGSFDIALLSVNKSLEIDPTNIEAWMVKGDSFYALGMYKDSLDCYNKLTQLSPYDTKAYNSKAKVLLKLGNYKE